jgi:5-methylcytosine-specific restriction endonuclease McrBC regulatory subunit McrC
MSINPDLVFSSEAVGDVKYKADWDAWPRSDLYQSVAFAAGYERRRAVVVSFGGDQLSDLETAVFGEIEVSHLQWRCNPNREPQESEAIFIEEARAWWDACVAGQAQGLTVAV